MNPLRRIFLCLEKIVQAILLNLVHAKNISFHISHWFSLAEL